MPEGAGEYPVTVLLDGHLHCGRCPCVPWVGATTDTLMTSVQRPDCGCRPTQWPSNDGLQLAGGAVSAPVRRWSADVRFTLFRRRADNLIGDRLSNWSLNCGRQLGVPPMKTIAVRSLRLRFASLHLETTSTKSKLHVAVAQRG